MVQFCTGKRNERKYWMAKKENSMLKTMGTGWIVANEAHTSISVFRLERF